MDILAIGRCAALAGLVCACAQQNGSAMGTMIPGSLYTQDGRVMPFAIEKTTGSGLVTASDPATQEEFSGNYVAVMETISSSANAFATNGYSSAIGFGSGSVGSNIADANAYLRGDQGTMLTCTMKIQAGINPHGLGSCSDNSGRSYRLQF